MFLYCSYIFICRYPFRRAPIDEGSTKRSVVVERGVVTADGLAVDWVHLHLYWTDTGTDAIVSSDLDGGMRRTVVRDELEEPRAVAVYPEKG